METNPSHYTAENQTALQSTFVPSVFAWMTVALAITAFTALFTVATPAIMNFIFSSKLTFFGLIFAELGLVMGITAALNRISSPVAVMLFLLYAVLNGLTLSSIFLAYELGTIGFTFLVTAGTFAAMSIYGYFTKEDLTKLGSLLGMGLIGLVFAIVVNLFLKSDMVGWVINLVGVFIFVGLVAWDTQKLKLMSEAIDSRESARKMSIMGALSLYLDFINLFLFLLRLFSRRN